MTRRILSAAFSVAFAIFGFSCASGETAESDPDRILNKKSYEQIKAQELVTISEINERKPEEGVFEVGGYIAKIYTCPPCPPDASCKPCMRENIVISEEEKTIDGYDLSKKELVVFIKGDESVKKGAKYLFKIRVTKTKTTNESVNDIELLGFRSHRSDS